MCTSTCTHKTRRPLATDHDLLAIHIPHTRFIHTSRLHIVTFTALSLSALIHSCNEPRCPLLRTPHTHLTLSTVSFAPPTTSTPLITTTALTHTAPFALFVCARCGGLRAPFITLACVRPEMHMHRVAAPIHVHSVAALSDLCVWQVLLLLA